MTKSSVLAGALVCTVILACTHPAPESAPTPARGGNRPTTNTGVPGTGTAGGSLGAGNDSTRNPSTGPKPYPRVITREAKTRSGMFKTHIVGEKLYFEIPNKEMNRDMLLVGRFERSAATPGDFEGYGGDQFTERTLRWERSGNRVILRSPSFGITADSTQPIARAVMQSNNPTVVAIFPVEAYGPDSAAVIDVTRLYTSGIPEFASSRACRSPARGALNRPRGSVAPSPTRRQLCVAGGDR